MRFVLLIIFALTFNLCYATNYFVNSVTGAASNDGLSPLRTKKQIQQAADLTQPGDTVFVMGGYYSNECSTCNVVNVPVSGTKGKYIVYMNFKDQSPRITFDGWAAFAIRNDISYIKIVGFEIIGNNDKVTLKKALQQPKSCENPEGSYDPQFNGNGIIIDGRDEKYPHHIVVSNNIVRDCGGGGISAIHSDYITVEDNLIYNTSWYAVFGTSGISFYQFRNYDNNTGYHNVIRRNKCFNNRSMVPWFKTCKLEDGNGIIIDDFMNKQNGSTNGLYRGRTLIENNICWNNGGTGIHTFQSSYVDILNNTAYLNSRVKKINAGEILAGSSSHVRILNNIMVVDKLNRINTNYRNAQLTYENNLHYNLTTPRKMKISVSSKTCINGKDPLFTAPKADLNANFSLKESSPAINHSNTKVYSSSDYRKSIRQKNNVADIGAYEYSP